MIAAVGGLGLHALVLFTMGESSLQWFEPLEKLEYY